MNSDKLSVDDFTVGKRYKIKLEDRRYPQFEKDGKGNLVETGEEILVRGKVYDATVLSKPEDKPDYICVHNHKSGIDHLIHVPSINKCELLPTKGQ